ncbi:putative bifunctional diguanylate cyclase/phosphodiesterase [Glaciecola sp. SC05]|uniref:putative bifunctional diguanylate cyclase/phosphodiesterase n=1 Tax=Glaciecola sp. SC05 TaxID=1987355 RepID=UPI0035278CB2
MTSEESQARIALLERRILREKTARASAESILEEKSKQLYEANYDLVKAVSDLEKLTVAVEQSPIIVLISDVRGIVEYVNCAFTDLSGYTQAQVLNKDIRSLGLLIDKEPMEGIRQVMENKTIWRGDIRGLSQTKQAYRLKLSISPIIDEVGYITHFLYNCEDVTKQKENEEKIFHLAHHDSLTDLYNRFSINGILQQAISSSERNKSMLSAMFIDMDRFKQINDTHGHKVGDELLQQVANRLSGICRRKSDFLARIGGDEFLVILTDIEDISFTALTAQAIVEILSLPYFIDEHELTSSPSIGIALYPNDGKDANELIKNADIAMYHAKNNGRRNYSFFTEELNKLVAEKNHLEAELRSAIDNQTLQLYYQPQIYLDDEKAFGLEALLRWNHPTLGFISPEKFIAIAEERGLIYDLGNWVIDTAFKQLKAWLPDTNVAIKMAINLSAKQIEDKRFIDDLKRAISQYNIDTTMIELEITESIAMKDPAGSIATLSELRDLGFELSIDDFGTGYSSLAYLKHLPIQTLKLDRSFIDNLEEDQDNAKICKASISLSHDLGLRFVAEGVETKGQAQYLLSNACDVLQGYYFCRPVPAAEAFAFINEYRAHTF